MDRFGRLHPRLVVPVPLSVGAVGLVATSALPASSRPGIALCRGTPSVLARVVGTHCLGLDLHYLPIAARPQPVTAVVLGKSCRDLPPVSKSCTRRLTKVRRISVAANGAGSGRCVCAFEFADVLIDLYFGGCDNRAR